MFTSSNRSARQADQVSDSTRRRWRFGWIVALVLFLEMGTSESGWYFSPSATQTIAAQETEPTVEQSEQASNEKEDAKDPAVDSDATEGRRVVKIIPDLKVLVDSPATTIDLADKFKDLNIGNNDEIEFAVEHNTKPKYAEASIELGGKLMISYAKIGKTEITVRATNKSTGEFVDSRFRVTVWEPNYFTLVQILVGGLAVFLLGMKYMSEGLQAVAGNGLRRMISAVTNNRFKAAMVGTAVTCVVQSSSITTVMVVGFVNSGFMTLSQAIGVVMGANIGTTITGWLLVLKIGKYGLPILGLAGFVYLFTRRERLRYLAMAIMGVGFVFFGLQLMKNGFSSVKDLPAFEEWFHQFQADSYFGVLKCAMVGCLLTVIVQSSSATLGITITLASIGVIPFETAAALVLGENIGTTITAYLASLGSTTNAKRAAYFHVMFNMVGVAWITAVFPYYLPCVEYFVTLFPGDDNLTAKIAATHTGFNVINTLLFLPFAGVFNRLLLRIVPDRHDKEKPHLTSLDIRMLETPVIGIEQSRIEMLRMAEGDVKMIDWLAEITSQDEPDDKLVKKTFHREEVLDTIQDEVVAFMTDLLATDVTHSVVDEARRQLRITDELESVSDYISAILKSHLKLYNANLTFTEDEKREIAELHMMCRGYLQLVVTGLAERRTEIITKAKSEGSAITARVKELRNMHLQRLSEQKVDPQLNVAFMAQLNAYRRIRDHILNIAEAAAGEK